MGDTKWNEEEKTISHISKAIWWARRRRRRVKKPKCRRSGMCEIESTSGHCISFISVDFQSKREKKKKKKKKTKKHWLTHYSPLHAYTTFLLPKLQSKSKWTYFETQLNSVPFCVFHVWMCMVDRLIRDYSSFFFHFFPRSFFFFWFVCDWRFLSWTESSA